MPTHQEVQTAVTAAFKAAGKPVPEYAVNAEVATRGRVKIASTTPQYLFHEVAYDLASGDTPESVVASPLMQRLLGE